MKKNSSRYLAAGLLIAWLVDFLFYKKTIGIAYPLWVLISILTLFFLAKIEKIKPAKLSYLLALAAIALSTANFFRLEPLTRFTSVSASLLISILLVITFRNGFWLWYRFVDYLLNFLIYLGGVVTKAAALFKRPKAETDSGENPPKESAPKPLWAILRGLLVAVPILFILSALLASADPIFDKGLQNFFALFKVENWAEYFFRVIYILIFAYIFTSSFLFAFFADSNNEKPDPNKTWLKPFLGNIETSIVLGSIVFLFGAFVLIQIQYFFGGTENISLEGFTYAEYARRGFGELVIVAVLSLGIYLVFHTITKKLSQTQRRLFSVLSILIFVEVLVILVSSYQRLNLYESVYGFSRLRTYSHLFIPWLAALIITVIVLEILQKQGHAALVVGICSVGFIVTLIISNIDGFIAQQNIMRAQLSDQEGYRLDSYYLSELSNDAVPVIFNSYQHTSGDLQSALGADMACRWLELTNQNKKDWQGYNLSQVAAEKILLENEADWLTYQPDARENSVILDGEIFYCGYRWID
jgi:hypothetical protein